ncbi:MAG: AmmeMemoRadiSam system protein A [Succinivibrionaceae bacterium]|nr:AmmeMemoRadiSam system protein A [Succinivibrionaceae bacterium]
MAGALDGLAVTCRTLSHEGTFGVGYGVATFAPQGEDPSRHPLADYLAELRDERQGANAAQDPYARLARETIEAYIGEGRLPPLPENLPKGLTGQRAGAFVSLHKFGELRGCIGTFLPTCQSVAEEIRQNAVSASTRDPRFPAITADELPYLEYSVDVLGAPEPIASEAELDPRRYGVIVSCRGKRGLLLPDLEGVDTVAQQVAIARRKAGIGPQEPVELQRFTVERHH